MALFTRRRRPATDTADLGVGLIALRLDSGDVAPAHSTVVVFNAAGHARRVAAGRVRPETGEQVFCFHPGPYTVDVIPFAAAPELGLRLRFVIDAANPRVSQQRFDLYLYSETAGRLALAGFGASLEAALQAEVAQGALELPPCTSVEEWHAFRAGLNQLLYTRYGVTVDDCVPVDLGDRVEFADVLRARRLAAANPYVNAGSDPEGSDPELPGYSAAGMPDAQALRRLFLELPACTSQLRLLTLPEGQPIFQQHQQLLLRLGTATLNVTTMPSLGWAAPDQPLGANDQRRRTDGARIAVAALDEAWSLLARLQLADTVQWPPLLDEADRICANLETGLAQRRTARAELTDPTARTEPSL